MPTTVYLPRVSDDFGGRRSGISIVWTKTVQRIDVSGWYDTHVGIEGDSMTLREFFDLLGITNKDCAKAWKSTKEN